MALLRRNGVLAGVTTVVLACGTTHLSEPVGRGQTRLSASAGGPVVRLGGAPIPVPLTTIGLAHGLTSALDVHGDLQTTAALFDPGAGSIPVLGADLGAAWHPLARRPAALTVGATAYGFTNRLDAVLLGDVWLATGGRVAPWLFLAGGVHNGLRLATTDATLRARPVWAPTLFALASVRPGGGRVALQVEARWYALTENGARLAPAWATVGDLGALGLLFGITYQFERGAP